jgi:hypothetical protein
MLALQMFLGFCTLHPLLARWPKIGVPPSGFFKYARSLEISLAPSFPWQIPCSNPDFHEVEALRHDPNDFHWLRLEKLSRLRSIDIWVASRSISLEMGTEVGFTALNQLEVPALERAVSCFANIQKVTLSTPLHGNVEPEDGWMEGLSHSNVRVWKRGTGDRFHPLLVPPNPGKPLDGIIYTSQRR